MRKTFNKFLSILLAVILVCSIGIVSAYADYPAYISGNGVNFRSGPGTSYAIKGAYSYGTPVTVVKELETGWCQVSILGVSGYVYGAYVVKGTYPENTPISKDYSQLGAAAFINTDNVNWRIAPSTSYASIGVLAKGTAVEIVETLSNGWYGVLINGYPGYVFGAYISTGAYTPAAELLTSVSCNEASYITANGVVVRSAPSSGASALATLNKGQDVTVLAKYSNDWYGISYKEISGVVKSGYVYGPYVSLGSYLANEVLLQKTAVDYYGFINKDNVGFYIAPSFEYALASYLPLGTELHVVEEYSNGWLGVISGNGNAGFVYGPYVTAGSYSGIPTSPKVAPVVISYNVYDSTINTNNTPFSVYPASDYAIMSYLSAGTAVHVVEQYSNGWCGVYINGTPGFIYSSFIN